MNNSSISNYETTRNAMEKKFLEYDQKQMISKFGLENSEEYLYMNFVSRRISLN